ncbi:very-short-patch-repair endonuclease [Silvimonas terrae]|uniref:Very-short-patch-repair endonuclease n=1 Tax=Silvimonas terrae TaxID=300266 RepID=A0A840RCN9_9NEIS|nr:DUF2726 domain-containing protein [Silvimonas terrae]MBB5190727.1 very-short-patch-repair endonuclease [Silvimonas terrae]
MKALIVLIVLVVIAGAVLSKKKGGKTSLKDRPYPYKKKATLCSAGEVVFFEKLRAALPEHHIFAQVQISRIVDVTDKQKSQQWRSRIDRKSADFVVCDAKHQIVAVIELDDATHARKDRQARDVFVEAVFEDAGIKLVRFHAREVINLDVIKLRVLGSAEPVLAAV